MLAANHEPSSPSFYRLAWVFYLAVAVGGVLWLGLAEGSIGLGLFFDTSTWWLDIAVGLLAAGGLLFLWSGARKVSAAARRFEKKIAAALGPLNRGEAISLAVLSGVAEELFFRGAMLQAWGVVASTLLFAVLHAGPGRDYRLWTLFAAIAGAAFAGLAVWRGNLLAPIEAHVVVNAVGLLRLSRLAGESVGAGARGET